MKAHIKLIYCVLTLFVFIHSISGYAEIYEYQYTPPASVDPDGFAHYKLYIPDNLDTVHGIYCFLSGWQGNSHYILEDEYYLAWAAEKNMALMGFRMLGAYTNYELEISLWSGEAFVNALGVLADSSGHPEVEFAPLLFDGWSAGGQFSYHFAKWKPERVIAFVTIKGGYHSISPAGDAIHVPGYMFIGENDLPYRLTNLTGIFEEHRPLGALWALALEPDAGHERVASDIIHAYFDVVVPMRMPDEIPMDTLPILNVLVEETGWLGNRDTYEIASYPDYAGNIDLASWFPNEDIAEDWQNFVQGLPITSISNPKAKEKIVIHSNQPNPFKTSTTFLFELLEKLNVTLTIYDCSGTKVETLTDEIYTTGKHEIIWKPKGLVNGIYHYTFEAAGFSKTGKLIINE